MLTTISPFHILMSIQINIFLIILLSLIYLLNLSAKQLYGVPTQAFFKQLYHVHYPFFE